MIHKTIVLIILNEMNFLTSFFPKRMIFLIKLLNLFYNLMKKNICLLNKKLEKAESLDSFENIFTLIMHF